MRILPLLLLTACTPEFIIKADILCEDLISTFPEKERFDIAKRVNNDEFVRRYCTQNGLIVPDYD